MTTPDEYRYAKAHLRAAIDHLKLAQHYVGDPDMTTAREEALRRQVKHLVASTADAYDHALGASMQPFTPQVPAP